MKNYEEIMEMFSLTDDDKIYFDNKGKMKPMQVTIVEDYCWSEAAGMLYGSEFEGYRIFRNGKELIPKEYENIAFKYIDNTEKYDETGKKYGKNRNCGYCNYGTNLKGCNVYVLYSNYNNNEIDSYNVDIFTIK